MTIHFFNLNIVILVLLFVRSECKSKKNSNNVILKKLTPIEIAENVPIGYTITDLKANLVDHHKNSDEIYFNFEFNSDFNENLNHRHHHNNKHHHETHQLLNSFNLNNYFILDSFTGILKTSKQLDLENFCDLNICSTKQDKTCTVSFRIKATKYYHTPNQQTGSSLYKDSIFHISFELIILDANEFEPEFTDHINKKDLILFNITEEFSPIKLPIGSVAYDNDCTDRNNLVYSLKLTKINNILVDRILKQSNTKLNDLISVMFNFSIVTDQMLLFLYSPTSLDREIVQNIELKIIATDRPNSTEAKHAELSVFINVIDINDNSPKFESQIINLELDEGLPTDTEIVRLKATDLDDNLNGHVSYEFAILNEEIKETFALNSSTGSLTLRKRLSYDQKSFWQLSIRASDQSLTIRKSSIAIINLHVNDINNHKPEINFSLFLINSYIGTRSITSKNVNTNNLFKEDIFYLSPKLPKNSAIGVLILSDKDSRSNGLIEYCEIQFLNEKNLIRLEPIDLDDEYFRFTSNEILDQEIKSLYYSDLKFSPVSSNEKRYLIRTNVNLNDKKGTHKFEIKASDSGINYKLTSRKHVTLIIGDTGEQQIYDTNSELNHILNILNQDYDLDDVGSAKNIYSISINENNKYPTELAKLTSNDFDITFDVTYSLLLMPTKPSNEYQLMNSRNIFQCSLDLYKYIFIGPLTGVLVLNASLDREMCSDYLFIIRASHLIEKRLNSFIYLHLNVKDLNDNRPGFEHLHYVFNVFENANINRTIGYPIRIIDQDSFNLNNITVDIISNDQASLISSYFSILKDNDELKVLLKQPLDYEKKHHYEFKLVVNDGINDARKVNPNRLALVEINVLDSNEHKPVIKEIVLMQKNSTNLVNLTKISNLDDDYLIVINLENIFSRKVNPLFELVKIEAQDLDSNEKLNFSIQQVKYLAYDNNIQLDESKTCISQSSLFNLKESRLIVDLNKFYHKADLTVELNECSIPLVALVEIKISDNGEPVLNTNLNLKLIFINNKLNTDKLASIENYLVEKYSSHPSFYLTSRNLELNFTKLLNGKPIYSENESIKNKSFKDFITSIHPPLIIICILILVLLLTIISLFVMSIIYSMSVCKFFKSKVNNVFKVDENNIENSSSECEKTKMFKNGADNKLVVKEDYVDYEGDGEKSDESDKSNFRHKLVAWLSTAKMFHTESNEIPNETTANQINENEHIEYLLDSPIQIRKFNDAESQSNYLKKYHLEYLMNSNINNSNSIRINESLTKQDTPNKQQKKLIAKFKKITFKCEDTSPTKSGGNDEKIKCNTTTTEEEDSQVCSSSNDEEIKKYDFDDDLIIPFKTTQSSSNVHYVKRPQLQLHKCNLKKKDSPKVNHVTYKKATFLPEDNIWIKKVIPNEIPKENYNNNDIINNEIVI